MEERSKRAHRNSNGRMRFYWGTAAATLIAAAALAAGPARAKEKKPQPDLSGTWILNPKQSDDMAAKLRAGMEARRERMGGGGYGGRGGGGYGGRGGGGYGGRGGGGGGWGGPRGGFMQSVLRQPDTLEVNESGVQIQMIEPGRIPVVLYPDGKDHTREVGEDASVTDHASWKSGALVVETKFGRGGKVTEAYALSKDGATLTIDAKMEPPRGGDTIEVKSVYEKAP
ncbi:MAG: hypothetical protein ACM3JJ_03765 [Hyphomicrobiales bacterium]